MQRARTKDAQPIAELEMDIFPDNCMNWKTIENEIRHGDGLVIYDGGVLVAYLLSRTEHGLTDILRLGVRSDYRGRWLGTQLLQKMLRHSGSTILCVRKGNRAIRLYLKHGFKIVGQLEKSWVMLRHLDGAETVSARAAI